LRDRKGRVVQLVRRADVAGLRLAIDHRKPWLDPIATVASKAGRGGILWAASTAIAAFRVRGPKAAPVAATAVFAAFLASLGFARLVSRPRPYVQLRAIRPIGKLPDGPSFPSDQAASAAAGAYVLSRLVPDHKERWWFAAVSMSASRVYVGVHFPSDVLAGVILGSAIGRFWKLFAERLR
jgi:undecaprenyl-diphosphatase